MAASSAHGMRPRGDHLLNGILEEETSMPSIHLMKNKHSAGGALIKNTTASNPGATIDIAMVYLCH